ncbi:cytochrome P450 [Nocardia sp. NPDC049220]|uniref:cytochrome P450 n=1 Tax=Nocardia sp. NPDC049220 TaxID=3155273 RepID=UPI0033C3AF8D
MIDSHQDFFDGLDFFDERHCARLDDELKWAREQCPVVHTNFGGGMHIVTRYADLRTVAVHPEVFSSAQPGIVEVPVALPPLDLDPPLHGEFRGLLNNRLSRAALARYRPILEKLADELIDDFVQDGEVEFISRFAIPFTAGTLAKVVLDDDNEERLQRGVDAVTAVSVQGTPESFAAVAELATELMAARESDRRDDFLQSVVEATVAGGRPLTQEERLGLVTVLLLGGLDTTRGTLGYIGQFLAEQPNLEARLREPNWANRNLDELLRLTSTVSVMGRVVLQDNDLLGIPLVKGDRVAVHWRSGNRDAAKFDNPDQLDLDRFPNPHMAFGVGIHRCVGQHIARLQLEIGVNRLLARLTNFRIAPGTSIRSASGVSIGAPEELHLQFDQIS